ESAATRPVLLTADDLRAASAWNANPDTQLLSNGRYAVMLTAAGSGYSRWRDLAITRWREDSVCDNWGSYIFLRDVQSGEVWSATPRPIRKHSEEESVIFNEDRVEFAHPLGPVSTTVEIVVSPEDDAEVRRVTISNTGSTELEIELTSYMELALASPAA